MTLYFITGNKDKFREIKALLPEIEHYNLALPEIQEIDAQCILKAKLLEAMKHKQGDFIVEDTSLYLECLHGLPGPLIKWFLKTAGTEGLWQLTEKYCNFAAEAKTIIGYAHNTHFYFFEGTLKGKIVKPSGNSGFGWDCIFQPEGCTKTFAEMTAVEKNAISMRTRALNALMLFLESHRHI